MQLTTKAGLTLALLASAALVPIASQAQTTITFDEASLGATTSDAVAIPNGYQGLNWTNFGVLNTTQDYAAYGPDGYSAGLVSGKNVAYNGGGTPASFSSASTLTLNSLYLTAAYNDNLNVTITGKKSGVAVLGDLVTETLSATAPTLYTLNWTGLDEVDFASFGGTQHAAYTKGMGTQFVLDNLTINGTVPTPTPTSLTPETPAGLLLPLALLPMGLIAFNARRRKAN